MSNPPSVLIVDDEPNIVLSLQFLMKKTGFEVRTAKDGEEAMAEISRAAPDLVLLDVMMPKIDGFSICARIRANPEWKDMRIIMLTARGRDVEREKGLALGADDYITKPFELDELLARVNAILRRARPSTDVLVLGDVSIDFVSRTAWRGPAEIHLTHREFTLLKYMAERPGRVVSREDLLRDVWEYHDPGITRAVDHAVNRLRTKIESDPQLPRFIHTAVGVGYLLTPEGHPPPQ